MKSAEEQTIGLRNERKPCHFWVDNEVADCYQPIVGADAIWVYCRIARYANGAWIVSPRLRGTSDARVSLAEMAEWCGKSRATVWRSLQVLELVGLVNAEGGTKTKGRYALGDVKDLVLREGGAYDREMGSFQLPASRVAELKECVRALRLSWSAKSDTLTVVEAPEPADESVSVGNSSESNLFHHGAATVSPESKNLLSGETDSRVLDRKPQDLKKEPVPLARAKPEQKPDPRAASQAARKPPPSLRPEVKPGASPLRPVNEDICAEMGLAACFFQELGVPSDFAMRDLAAQAIRLQAPEWNGMRGSFERMLGAARKAKAAGETRWRFWLTDQGYLREENEGTGGRNGGTGKNRPSAAKQRVDGSRRALAEAAFKRGWFTADSVAGSGAEAVAEPGHGDVDRRVPDGLRASEPEILTPRG